MLAPMSTTPFMRAVARLLATPQFRSFAHRILPGEGEDVLQEAALAVHRHELAGHKPPENLPAWLSVVVRREALTILQARKAKRVTPRLDPAMALDQPGLFPLGSFDGEDLVPACGRNVEAELAQAIDLDRERERVRAAVGKLDPGKRKAVEKTFFGEVAIRDRAGQGAPHGSVVSRLSRAKDDLAAELAASRPVPAHLRVAV